MRRVPGMAVIHRLQLTIGQSRALQSVVLDIVGNQQLRLGIGRQSQVDQNACRPRNAVAEYKANSGAHDIIEIGMQPDCFALKSLIFCL